MYGMYIYVYICSMCVCVCVYICICMYVLEALVNSCCALLSLSSSCASLPFLSFPSLLYNFTFYNSCNFEWRLQLRRALGLCDLT